MFGGYNRRLEKRRTAALSAIGAARLSIEAMTQRPRSAQDTLDEVFVRTVLDRVVAIEERAKQASDTDDLDDLVEVAEQQGQLRAYICPVGEIANEGGLAMNEMEEWNIPKAIIAKLRQNLGEKLPNAGTDPLYARGALRALYDEYDSWARYTSDYEEDMQRFTRWLFAAATALPLLAILAFHWTPTFLVGLVAAGAAGSCASVMTRMPLLDVSLSGELAAYGRRILSRVGVGIVASLIGCALLGWGLFPISIQNQTFADVLNACWAACSASQCTTLKLLVALGVPMLFGFSERALTSFEQNLFGK
jgi:hypothetical protein